MERKEHLRDGRRRGDRRKVYSMNPASQRSSSATAADEVLTRSQSHTSDIQPWDKDMVQSSWRHGGQLPKVAKFLGRVIDLPI